MKLHNTLTRKIEEFKPFKEGEVGIYSCGPTVYYYPQIGNWRTFIFEDVLRRVFEYEGYKVTQVMNATDVGHLTGDNLGDADLGEDRMEKAAKREGKSAWEIADYYIADFKESSELLNIEPPTKFVRATDHIPDQINLIRRLSEKGLAYQTRRGIYFDVEKFPTYGRLGGQKLIDKRVATREELVEDGEKHNPRDFALWKFSLGYVQDVDEYGRLLGNRQMEWWFEGPFAGSLYTGKDGLALNRQCEGGLISSEQRRQYLESIGFPGWHIECSAMSMKYLGDTFDVHTGGIDHIAIHHTNEMAQSEGATGKPLAHYWLHGEFLTVDGGRMGKSLGNSYTLHDIVDKDYNPLALRYLYLTAHYRDSLNFTWGSLDAAQTALNRLYGAVAGFRGQSERTMLSREKLEKVDGYRKKFVAAISDDLALPQALAVVWEVVKSNIPSEDKYDLLMEFDQVLGLKLSEAQEFVRVEVPEEIQKLVERREKARKDGKWEEADAIRKQIQDLGFKIEDTNSGSVISR